MKFLNYIAKNSITTLLSLLISLLILAGCVYFYMVLQLPNVDALKDARLQVPLRVYSSDGKLIAEYGQMRRSPVSLAQIPKPLIEGVIATEDRRFFEHSGVDFIGLIRASKELIITGQKTQGASTITMQVARNFFLTRKKTFTRKINEILLALKINSTFSKDKILELYLNKIYLGQRAYGVAAAAQIYYGKTLDQLTLPEMAMIAGLPQAPSKDNPITDPVAAKDRRNHVLERMLEDGYINQKTYAEAIQAPITASYHGTQVGINAPYVGEMVRDAMVAQYGDAAYSDGFAVYTTVDSTLQKAANKALHDSLISYAKRHGYNGAEANWGEASSANMADWQGRLGEAPVINELIPAVVTTVQDRSLQALLANGHTINLPWSALAWTNRPNARAIAKPGDLIRVEHADANWQLSEVPKVEGALVSLDPKNGAIYALVGGFNYEKSNFNRVTQALRQPGSSFKPFIYAAALDKGYTLATVINDAPIVLNDTGQAGHLWRPQNDDLKFYGPTRLRSALMRSSNIVTLRLLQLIGIPYAIDYATRFGFDRKQLPASLSMALGSADVTPLQMVDAYAVFANGGYRVAPYFIQSIKSGNGKVIFTAQPDTVGGNPAAPQVIPSDVAYLMTSALQDVIRHGTGRSALVLKRADIAGKTGTSNNQMDAWFSGYNGNIVTTAWVGYDQPQSLYEYSWRAAMPVWIEFMRNALAGQPETQYVMPSDIVMVRINPNTGLLANPDQSDAIFEMFRKATAPTQESSAQDANTLNNGDSADAHLF
jgi:penicillin-binding protein 1A